MTTLLLGLLVARLPMGAVVSAPLPPNAAYRVQWTQDTAQGPQFRLWVDEVIAKNYKTSEVTCTPTTGTLATCTAPGVPFTVSQIGTHEIRVSAYNAVGESKSDPVPVTVNWASAPPAPAAVSVVIGS